MRRDQDHTGTQRFTWFGFWPTSTGKTGEFAKQSEENYNAKIPDFGLARNGPHGKNSHVSTCVMGTYGYAAPEYVATGHLYVKSDVYSFGIVLLEMLSGMRALDSNHPSEQHSLVKWAEPYLSDWSEVLSRVMDGGLKAITHLKVQFRLLGSFSSVSALSQETIHP